MNRLDESLDDRLIATLLRRLDAELETVPPGAHPDEETLALFALGRLDPAGRAEVIHHLSECIDCRQAVAALLSSAEQPAVPEARHTLPFAAHRRRLLVGFAAVAAVLLLATALFVILRPPDEAQVCTKAEALLRQGNFPAARTLLGDAGRRGVRSDRLRSLEAQAERELPGPVALALAGRLSDFGFGIDGVTAREGGGRGAPQDQARRACELLAACGSDDDAVVLNRGHLLLTLGEPAKALAEFEAVAARSPREPLAWLGAGLAHYLLQDYAAAERAFRASLDADAASVPARVNLAMTLEEEGETDKALAEWQRLLAGPLPDDERAQIERVVSELRRERGIVMRHLGVIAWFGLLALAPAARAENSALVVGVNDCPDFRLPGGKKPVPLRGAEADADAVARLLTHDYGFAPKSVVLLKGREATCAKVKAGFADLVARLGKDDVFVFHFSGHGTRLVGRPPRDGPDGLHEALCPWDANDKEEHLIVDTELGRWLDKVPARQLTVLLDCCHARPATKGDDEDVQVRALPGQAVPRKDAKPKAHPWPELRDVSKSVGQRRTAFFACQADQMAYERLFRDPKPPARAGQFTHYFLAGLRDRNADADGDGVVSNQELYDYIARRVKEEFNAKREPADRQEPALESSAPNAPVFGLKPQVKPNQRP